MVAIKINAHLEIVNFHLPKWLRIAGVKAHTELGLGGGICWNIREGASTSDAIRYRVTSLMVAKCFTDTKWLLIAEAIRDDGVQARNTKIKLRIWVNRKTRNVESILSKEYFMEGIDEAVDKIHEQRRVDKLIDDFYLNRRSRISATNRSPGR